MENTIVGVDLAKNVIQVCVFTNKKVRSNIEMTPYELTDWLANSKPVTSVSPKTPETSHDFGQS